MLDIYFKNVGHGDTILIVFKGKEKNSYGLVDCNLHEDGLNSLFQDIDELEINNFDFVILSHPHTDHFSGFLRFLDRCKSDNITINNFYSTSILDETLFDLSDEDFARFVSSDVKNIDDKKSLLDLYKKIIEQDKLNGKGYIKFVSSIPLNHPFFEFGSIKVRFLTPQNSLLRKYYKATLKKFKNDINNNDFSKKNYSKGNFLCTIIQIYDEKHNWQVLLTSDITKEGLLRIWSNDYTKEMLYKSNLLMTQVPHHGSSKNHFEKLWDNFSNKKNIDAIVSVGSKYKHPSKEVVNYFNEKFKKLHSTNYAKGFILLDKEFYKSYFLPEKNIITIQPEPFEKDLYGEKKCSIKLKNTIPECIINTLNK